MIPLVTTLLNNPFIQTLIVGSIGWGVRKIFGKRADTKAGKATAALAVAASQMAQFALTEPNKSPDEIKTAFKGIIAIQFAKVGFTEAERATYQPLIDVAISAAVTEWVKHHPDPHALTMPITMALAK